MVVIANVAARQRLANPATRACQAHRVAVGVGRDWFLCGLCVVAILVMSTTQATGPLVRKLCVLVIAMFGFGYAIVPLYSAFCKATQLDGRTRRVSEAAVATMAKDLGREVTVEFVTNVNSNLPWNFRPLVSSVKVHPGVETAVEFEVSNRSTDPIIGQAIPSIVPAEVARFFSKTECFCFTQQTLAAGETRRMPVRFVVNPKIPQQVARLTLGYTFFRATPQVSATAPRWGTLPKS